MTPSRFQLPPRPNGAPQTATARPPSKLTFFSFPSAKKPIDRPSGDQNGNVAPSVSLIGSALNFPNGRTQIRGVPLASIATNASLVPSALSTGGPPLSPMRLN